MEGGDGGAPAGATGQRAAEEGGKGSQGKLHVGPKETAIFGQITHGP